MTDEIVAPQQTITETAVRCYPGHTSLEIARRAQIDRHMLARRLPECEKSGTVKRSQARVCSVSGRVAATWWPAGHEPQQHLFPTDPACHAPTSPNPAP